MTVKDLEVVSPNNPRAVFGIIVTGASNTLLDNIRVENTEIGVGVYQGSDNVEIRQSEIAYAGDGESCPGCAEPSIWISDSSDVRVMQSSLLNYGDGPEGDGELACYNTPDLVVYNTTINGSGAAGMYLVNCDYAVVVGNEILSSEEWGIDLAQANMASGTDYGLFSWNLVQDSRHAAGVLVNSTENTFQNNLYINNRRGPNASGSCNGINLRSGSSGYYYVDDEADPWPVVCSD